MNRELFDAFLCGGYAVATIVLGLDIFTRALRSYARGLKGVAIYDAFVAGTFLFGGPLAAYLVFSTLQR